VEAAAQETATRQQISTADPVSQMSEFGSSKNDGRKPQLNENNEESAPSRRKQTRRAVELNGCLCGSVVDAHLM